MSTTALFLCGVYVPVAGAVLMVFTPQPGLSLEHREGRPLLASLLVLSTATAALVAGPRAAILYVAGFALLTWVLAALLRGEWSIEATIGIATAILALTAASAAVFLFPSAEAIVGNMRGTLEEAWRFLIDFYRRSGMPADVVDQLASGGDRFVDLVVGLAPGLAVSALGGVVLANVSLVRWRQRRQGVAQVFGDLTRWSTPPATVWLLIAVGYASFLPVEWARAVASNVLAVLLAVYLCQGLAILQFTFRKWRVPVWARVLAYGFVAVEWLATCAVVLFGIFDLWADFRRLTPRPIEDDDD
ncbi:MAG: DUF2232 domain-containing protein [Candidatus Binatia bacterium]